MKYDYHTCYSLSSVYFNAQNDKLQAFSPIILNPRKDGNKLERVSKLLCSKLLCNNYDLPYAVKYLLQIFFIYVFNNFLAVVLRFAVFCF